ncbi:MAG: hypothetical protein DRP89_05715 [Candidatus Neomarinimicrobiota bacterium]|nr:MAG: hypothetical protein DRP89_05715 [Candidatus Neomarinimicrobiota bacterium]
MLKSKIKKMSVKFNLLACMLFYTKEMLSLPGNKIEQIVDMLAPQQRMDEELILILNLKSKKQ